MASISDKVGDLGGYLREQREHARLSVRQLATLTGVSNPYLSQVERGLRNPSAEVLQQIAKGLRISAEALYVKAGILEQQQRPGVEDAVGADGVLTDRQKRVLLDIYAAFLTENARVERDASPPQDEPQPRRAARSRVGAKRSARRVGGVGTGRSPVAGPPGEAESSAPGPSAPEPSAPEPSAPGPSAPGPSAPGSSAPGPSRTGRTASTKAVRPAAAGSVAAAARTTKAAARTTKAATRTTKTARVPLAARPRRGRQAPATPAGQRPDPGVPDPTTRTDTAS